jgi:hypothetical protein
MKKTILAYRKAIDSLLEKGGSGADWDAISNPHLIKLAQFQHARLIHLIVPAVFAILEMLSLIMLFSTEDVFATILSALFFVLLLPYVVHYYTLENEVQRMYAQYDRIAGLIQQTGYPERRGEGADDGN